MLLREHQILGAEMFGLKVDWVHGERKDRHKVVRDFKNGKIDVLVGSYILKRGKNFPLMTALIHAAGGRSASTVLQVLGRATRKHESKEYTVVDDFWDTGKYLETHSRKRYKTYIKEQIKVFKK
jgi:superfamily II DNA or RNA helicase